MTEHGDFKIGDLILTYHSGYHRIIGFHVGDISPGNNGVQIHYVKVLNTNGNPTGKRYQQSCHDSYCQPITRQWIATKRVEWHNAIDTKINHINDALTTPDTPITPPPKRKDTPKGQS